MPNTIANVYFSNKAHLTFCKPLVHQLKGFTSECLILGGDFNIPLNPLLDTSTGKTSIRYKTLKQIKSLLHSLQLVDSWRFLNPDGRDDTFYSIPHKKYVRLDYLFISQNDLPTLTDTRVGIQTTLDYAPIALALDLPKSPPKSQTWRLNSSIISDPSFLTKLTETLKAFFKPNTPEMDPLVIWEAH